MNSITFHDPKLAAEIGAVLLHSIWQIALVAGLLWLILRFDRRSPAFRHNLCLLGLLASLALPCVTFVRLHSAGPNFLAGRGTATNSLLIGHESSIPGETSEMRELGSNPARQPGRAGSKGLGPLLEYLGRGLADVLPIAAAFWLLGVAVLSVRLAGGFAQLRRYRTTGVTRLGRDWDERFGTLVGRIKVPLKVRLLVSDIVSTPVSIGVCKPVILVPASALLHVPPHELEMIVAHELIHIRRLDPLVSAIQGVIETLLFYHPAVWWMSARLRREREFATDVAVIDLFEGSETAYARTLATLEELRLQASTDGPRLAPAANGGNLMKRIKWILQEKTEVRRASSAWTAYLAIALASAFVLGALWLGPGEVVNAHGRFESKKLAIGFVSIPPLDRTANPPLDADATARLLIDKLKKHKVPAIGFLQGGMISDGEKLLSARASIARLWRDAGFEIGLGGFKHISLYHTPVDDYIANIEKNERVAKQLIGAEHPQPRYFSYPFLNAGKTAADRAKVETWLASRGYTPLKFTVDNSEWMYSYAYDMARNDNDVEKMREIRESYLDYMSRMLDHFESYSQEMFGRDIAQTMVLTPSRLITDTADDFFTTLRKKGYSFVSVDEAQSDPAYKTPENFNGTAGISWFERWAIAKGQSLREEPKVDPEVERVWNARAKK